MSESSWGTIGDENPAALLTDIAAAKSEQSRTDDTAFLLRSWVIQAASIGD